MKNFSIGFKKNIFKFSCLGLISLALGCGLWTDRASAQAQTAEPGITSTSIRVGAYMPLEGDRKVNALAFKKGVDTALANQTVRGLHVDYQVLNDFYDPAKSIEVTKKLIETGIFAMLGPYGTHTLKATLPLLAENKVPVVAPLSGAGLTGPGDIFNVRVSTVNEIESIASAAMAAGLKPSEICGYFQNDAFGLNGVNGMRMALAKQKDTQKIVTSLDQVLSQTGDNPQRNNIGPVGFYTRDTLIPKEGHASLKNWEKATGAQCRLVLTVGVYDPIVNFIAYAIYKNEPWIVTSGSTATGTHLLSLLKDKEIIGKARLITTEVFPLLTSSLPIILEARKALGSELSAFSFEGFLYGKLFLAILQATDKPLTRENFLKAARRQVYDLGGFKVDFTKGNQGYNSVEFLTLKKALLHK